MNASTAVELQRRGSERCSIDVNLFTCSSGTHGHPMPVVMTADVRPWLPQSLDTSLFCHHFCWIGQFHHCSIHGNFNQNIRYITIIGLTNAFCENRHWKPPPLGGFLGGLSLRSGLLLLTSRKVCNLLQPQKLRAGMDQTAEIHFSTVAFRSVQYQIIYI